MAGGADLKRKQTLTFGAVVFMAAFIVGIMVHTNTPQHFTIEEDTLANPGIEKSFPVPAASAETTAPVQPADIEETVRPPAEAKININTATVEELDKLDGVGEKIAQRIIQYREKHGAFEVIEDIMKVSGIGEKKFANMKDDICVE